RGSALARAHERVGSEGGFPRLAHARRAEAERRLVQAVELALAVAADVDDVQVAQDAELVRRGRRRRAERAGQVAPAQLAERERVDELAAGGVAERAEHARQALDVRGVLERATHAIGRRAGARPGRAVRPGAGAARLARTRVTRRGVARAGTARGRAC